MNVERSSSSPRRDSPGRRYRPGGERRVVNPFVNCSELYASLKPVRRMAPQPCLRRAMSYIPARR
jgi:hypothetical protein